METTLEHANVEVLKAKEEYDLWWEKVKTHTTIAPTTPKPKETIEVEDGVPGDLSDVPEKRRDILNLPAVPDIELNVAVSNSIEELLHNYLRLTEPG